MKNKERNLNLYLAVLLPVSALVLGLSVFSFPVDKIDAGLIALAVVTIFFSSYLRIQLPRTKIHLTISDALIILSLLVYGGEIAVILATLEAAFTSFNFRRQGVTLKPKTMSFNVAVACLAAFITSSAVTFVFTSFDTILEKGNSVEFVEVLVLMALSQFVVHSLCVSLFVALKSDKTFWQVWNEYCLNALVLFFASALLAGLSGKALSRIDMFLFAGVIGFFALFYITYRRYTNDVRDTAAKAEQIERERAEQAENHIVELQHFIVEQERIGHALRESKDRFRHAAYHDALTNLPNRNQFMDSLKILLDECRENSEYRFAVLFLDLDRFKTVNDSLGHTVGDQLLCHVANRLSRSVSGGDLVARLSGDEFALIIKDIENDEDTLNFAELIKHKLSAPFALSGRKIFTKASIGIAMGDASYAEAEEILRDADIAMYHAKENGKDYMLFDRTMLTRAVTLMQLETDLRFAVERSEFCVYYQPVIDLQTMALAGFEALARWNHPRRGLVQPGEFIPVCEDSGLIVPLTLQILSESCRQIVAWQKSGLLDGTEIISVNLSGKHFKENDLVAQISEIMRETGIDASCLKMEITESAVMENAESAIQMLKELKKLGIQLSIDDFGTGYSSLSYLHRFPIDTLKVDRSFVSEMESASENGEIVRTIIALAKTLGMNIIAEGIETIHQLHQLRILNCEYGQGYLFSRPIPAVETEILLEDKTRWQNIVPTQKSAPPLVNREISHLRLAN